MALSKLGSTFEILAVVFPDPDCLADQLDGLDDEVVHKLLNDTSFKCECCGSTRLAWPAVVANEHGKQFIVGKKCASNAVKGIDPHKVADMAHAAERVQRDHYLAQTDFTTWLKGLAHPKGWSGKSRLDDVRYWVMRKAPKMAVIRKAWREFAEAKKLGLVSPDGVQHSDEWHALAAFYGEHKDALKQLAHPLSPKRGFKTKKMTHYVEYMLDAKATVPSALERALVISKHAMGLGPSLKEIEAQKAAERAQAAKEFSSRRFRVARQISRATALKWTKDEQQQVPAAAEASDLHDSIYEAETDADLDELRAQAAKLGLDLDAAEASLLVTDSDEFKAARDEVYELTKTVYDFAEMCAPYKSESGEIDFDGFQADERFKVVLDLQTRTKAAVSNEALDAIRAEIEARKIAA